jgi:hypothetical protein
VEKEARWVLGSEGFKEFSELLPSKCLVCLVVEEDVVKNGFNRF